MKRFLTILALCAGASAATAQVGEKAQLDVVRWYNSPPISAEALQGHAVMVEVFRTW
jgi:hypothetical protein